MSTTTNPTVIDADKTCKNIALNSYTVTRIVYEVIKTFMLANTPEKAGVRLTQTFDADPKKSQILLDIAYNWRTKDMSKVPAIFVQREDAKFSSPTMGQNQAMRDPREKQSRFALCTLPVIVTCVAAEPFAVVENLAEYIKQPLLYFRQEVQADFGIRGFRLEEMTKPKPIAEGKNNFSVDLVMKITFDDGWQVQRDDLKIKHIGVELFDQVWEPLNTLDT